MSKVKTSQQTWLRSFLINPDDHLLSLAVLAAMCLSIWLIWSGKYPPFVDAANVGYTGEVMHDLWRGGHHYDNWHALRPGAISHLAFYRAYHLLRFVFAPVCALKVLVSVGVFGLPLATYSLVRALRQSPWLCLPAFALAFNTNLGMGFLPFVIGLPLLPAALALIECNRREPRAWRWWVLGGIVLLSPFVHFFLTVVLLPTVTVWLVLSHSGRPRVVALVMLAAEIAGLLFVYSHNHLLPPFQEIFQWVTFSERWDKFDRDVLSWTTDGCPALSFPWLLLAFVASLMLTRRTPRQERGLVAARLPVTLLMLFLLYQLGPAYISWPEPAWGFGARVAIALALLLPLTATTAARGWQRVMQCSPWVAFTFWHLCSLLAPFSAYDDATNSLASLIPLVPKYSTVLPLVGSEWMKESKAHSFGGFIGFVFRHTATWVATETQSYQPYSFCDMGYHPIVCKNRLKAPREQEGASLVRPQQLEHYDFVAVYANTERARDHLKTLPMQLVKVAGDWSLWRPVVPAAQE